MRRKSLWALREKSQEIKLLKVGIPPIVESKSTKFKSFNTKIKKMKREVFPSPKHKQLISKMLLMSINGILQI